MSTTAEDENHELLRLQAGEVRVYAPPAWLTRRLAIWALIGVVFVGPVPFTFVATTADQWLRNMIDDMMSGPDLYRSLSLQPEEYASLPLHWRQALAEVAVRDESGELAEVQKLIGTLVPDQIALIDRIAPYVIDGFLVRDEDHPSGHRIPSLALVDYTKLQDLGILQQRSLVYVREPTQLRFALSGTTVALVVEQSDQDSDLKIPATRLTEPGATLVELLRVPSDIRHFEWVSSLIDEQGRDVVMLAVGTDPDGEDASLGRIDRETVAPWPAPMDSPGG